MVCTQWSRTSAEILAFFLLEHIRVNVRLFSFILCCSRVTVFLFFSFTSFSYKDCKSNHSAHFIQMDCIIWIGNMIVFRLYLIIKYHINNQYIVIHLFCTLIYAVHSTENHFWFLYIIYSIIMYQWRTFTKYIQTWSKNNADCIHTNTHSHAHP